MMLTWPMGADQYTNANLLVGELGVGIRVAEETRRVPDSTELAWVLSEAVGGKSPQRVRAVELRDHLVNRLKELHCEKGTNGHF